MREIHVRVELNHFLWRIGRSLTVDISKGAPIAVYHPHLILELWAAVSMRASRNGSHQSDRSRFSIARALDRPTDRTNGHPSPSGNYRFRWCIFLLFFDARNVRSASFVRRFHSGVIVAMSLYRPLENFDVESRSRMRGEGSIRFSFIK